MATRLELGTLEGPASGNNGIMCELSSTEKMLPLTRKHPFSFSGNHEHLVNIWLAATSRDHLGLSSDFALPLIVIVF